MRAPILNIFKKKHTEAGKSAGDHAARSKGAPASTASASAQDVIYKTMPSWWVVGLAYVLAGFFWYLIHRFFTWFPPYLYEVFKNLKGLPVSWADIGLFWGERGLIWIAILAAVYHNLWQLGTRYKLASHHLSLENWFPLRRVTAIPYGSMRRVGYQQSVLGLLFDYGHIEIDTASPTGPLLLLNCPKPKKFVELLQPKVEAAVQSGLSHHKREADS